MGTMLLNAARVGWRWLIPICIGLAVCILILTNSPQTVPSQAKYTYLVITILCTGWAGTNNRFPQAFTILIEMIVFVIWATLT